MIEEELVDRLRAAVRVVDRAAVPDDLRSNAFERVLDAMGVSTGDAAAPTASSSRQEATTRPSDAALTRVADALELELWQIERVYELRAGSVRLTLYRRQLPAGHAAAMRLVALLLTVGRQLSGMEDETSLAVLRDECRALGVLDSPNASAVFGRSDLLVRGARGRKTARATQVSKRTAAAEITRLASGGRKPA